MESPEKSEKHEKSQGSIGLGVLFISLGVVCVVIIIMGFLTAKSSNDGMSLLFPLGLAALFCFPSGIYAIYRGIVNQKVAKKGTKSTCVVEKFTTIGGRGRATIWMDVTFKTQSGKEGTYSARVNDEAITNLKKGMVLECLVLGDECYIDPNNIKIVDESSLTADDTIEF